MVSREIPEKKFENHEILHNSLILINMGNLFHVQENYIIFELPGNKESLRCVVIVNKKLCSGYLYIYIFK